MYVGTGTDEGPGEGVFKSTDGGESWTAMNVGLGKDPEDTDVSALAIDPQTPATVYAGTYYHGVFKSTDGGRSWQAVNAGLPRGQVFVHALAIDPRRTATVYAATDRGFLRSTDGGGTWRPFSRGLTNLDVTAIAIASTGRVLYAGTRGGGVFDYRFPD